MASIWKRRIRELAMVVETTPGTFVAPAVDGSESKILLRGNPTIEFDYEVNERDTQTTDLDTFPAIIGKTRIKMTYQVEMRRTNTAATVDQWMAAMEAAGLAKTSPASNAVYTSNSKYSLDKTYSAYAYIGSSGAATIRVAIKGIAADISGEHTVGNASILSVTLHGVYNGFSTGGAVVAVSHEATKPSAFLGVTFTFNAVAVKISKFSWAMNNEVAEVEDVNETGGVSHFVVVGRKPTFSCDPLWELTATIDFNGLLLAGTLCAIAFNIQGANLTFAAPKAQITGLSDGDRNGLACAMISGPLCRNAGDDSIVITKA